MPTGYEQIYADLLPRLLTCDITAQAERLGLQPTGADCATAEFLGRAYLITPQGVEVADGGGAAPINNRSLLIYYITAEGGIEPRQSYVPINRLTGIIEGRNNDDNWFIGEALMRDLDSRYDLFVAAAEDLGGRPAGRLLGGQCWDFLVLPKMPMRLVFIEADEEFAAELIVQFDETAPYYMDFECLAFLSGSLLRELGARAKKRKESGLV
ncbi:MAG: DUF3786 domain-containing protein [Coriobacteriia bacterium]|nr:DUF3786 domain-containing protein [Coriobacteriia bacterium]